MGALRRGKPPRPARHHPLRTVRFAAPLAQITTFSNPEEVSPLQQQELARDRLAVNASETGSTLAIQDEADVRADRAAARREAALLEERKRDRDMLPPPYGAGYIVPKSFAPFEADGTRVVFKVDSGCDPFNIIRRDLVTSAGLIPRSKKTKLWQADAGSYVESTEVVDFFLRINFSERPRLIHGMCGVGNVSPTTSRLANHCNANGFDFICSHE